MVAVFTRTCFVEGCGRQFSTMDFHQHECPLHTDTAAALRTFVTGATRDIDTHKYDYEAFISPAVLEAFAAYMHVNKTQANGSTREGDNWQKGIPRPVYLKSWLRHVFDAWLIGRGNKSRTYEFGAYMGALFNNMGMVHALMQADPEWLPKNLAFYKQQREEELAARRKGG